LSTVVFFIHNTKEENEHVIYFFGGKKLKLRLRRIYKIYATNFLNILKTKWYEWQLAVLARSQNIKGSLEPSLPPHQTKQSQMSQ
jgi:hypothetical protein